MSEVSGLPPKARKFHPLAGTEIIPASEELAFAPGKILEREGKRYINTKWFPSLPFRGYPGDTPEKEKLLLETFSKKTVPFEEHLHKRASVPSEAMLPVSYGRAVLYPPAAFGDRSGEVFYDCVVHTGLTKVGRFRAKTIERGVEPITTPEVEEEPEWGKPKIEETIKDWENSEKLHKAGARTSLGVLIIEDKDGQHARCMRAFREGLRVRDLLEYTEDGEVEAPKQALMAYVKRKLFPDQKTEMSDLEYLEWFATTLGKQAALLQELRYIHGDLGGFGHYEKQYGVNIGNVTLAAEIVDHADGRFISQEQATSEDVRELARQYAYLLMTTAAVQMCLGVGAQDLDGMRIFTQTFLENCSVADAAEHAQVFQEELQRVCASLGRESIPPRVLWKLTSPFNINGALGLWKESLGL